MAGGPSDDGKRESSARDASHLIEESWRHLIVNLVIVALVAATVWVLVSGVRWTIEEGSGYLFAPFDAAAEGGVRRSTATGLPRHGFFSLLSWPADSRAG